MGAPLWDLCGDDLFVVGALLAALSGPEFRSFSNRRAQPFLRRGKQAAPPRDRACPTGWRPLQKHVLAAPGVGAAAVHGVLLAAGAADQDLADGLVAGGVEGLGLRAAA